MSDGFTGTNTEKIDKLITSFVELRTTMRVAFWVVGTTLPLLVALAVFLVTTNQLNAAKIDVLNQRVDRIEKTIDRIAERLDKLVLKQS